MKIFGLGEVLTDQFRADCLVALHHKASVRLMWEKDLADAGQCERVYHACQDCQKNVDSKPCPKLRPHLVFSYAR